MKYYRVFLKFVLCFFFAIHKEVMVRYFFRMIAPLLVLILVLAGCGQHRMPFESDEGGPSLAGAGFGLARAMEVQDKYTPGLMALTDVVGTATGLGPDARPAILVFTTAAGVKGISRSLDGVQVVVKVTGEFVALPKPENPGGGNGGGNGGGKPGGGGGGDGEDPVDPTSRFDRPVPIGVSTGHPAVTAGTIGARVTDGTNFYALSNSHVYAPNVASLGDAVIQPGTADGGTASADAIGTLFDFEPINFGGNNTIDAAIALSSKALLGNSTPLDGYGTPSSDVVGAVLGQNVQKYGRTTGLTRGTITAINFTVNVGYGSGTARFVDQIIVEGIKGPVIKGGDSGSLLVTDSGNPVGLLFAGNKNGRMAIANPIGAILSRFNVTIDGE